MDLDKAFYKSVFKTLFSDSCTVRYWDGEEETYGTSTSKFTFVLCEPLAKTKFMKDPSLAFGEAFMQKKIEIEGNLQEALTSIFNSQESFMRKSMPHKKPIQLFSNNAKARQQNIEHHYDIGNDFYKLWLDETMTYSCAYFKTEDDSLVIAQKNKIDHILKKLCLSPSDSLLDIGCGWGDLIISAAKKYQVKALGITLSKEQFGSVQARIAEEQLQDSVEVQLVDYRALAGRTFDRIVSVGMAEHLGKSNIPKYFAQIQALLNNGGVSLLHCITGLAEDGTNSWVNKYIFPGGYIPSVAELVLAISKEKFNLLDLESLRRHYAKTLELWAINFENALPEISKNKDEEFIRMWRLYLNVFAANFRSGNIDIHQFLFTKGINDKIPWTRDYIYQ
ncbi:MAG: cyclopropane-fatty-acyl-phospholipid synthase family protein [Clostridia bacterium]